MEALMKTVSKLVLLAGVAALAACSNDSTAPQHVGAPSEPTTEIQGSMQDLSATDTIRFSITINPWTNTTYYLGNGNSLYFPQGSLCSLWSSYGPTEWDKPCTPATSSVTVNAKAWIGPNGKPRVDFDKHIRFVPTTNPAKFVVIQFADLQASLDPWFNILYCPSATSSCYNEGKLDPSLLTVRNPITGKVTRRIKHFSGYNVAAGDEGDGLAPTDGLFSLSPGDLRLNTVTEVESMYPELARPEAEGFLETVRAARRSGYILASG
jgi:hypothetical protein